MFLHAPHLLKVEHHASRLVAAAQDDKGGKGAKLGKVDKKAERVRIWSRRVCSPIPDMLMRKCALQLTLVSWFSGLHNQHFLSVSVRL